MLTCCFSKRNLSCQEKAKVWVLRLKLSSCCSLRCWVFVSLCCPGFLTCLNGLKLSVCSCPLGLSRSRKQLPLCPFLFRNIPDPNTKRFSFRRGRGRRKIKITKMRWAGCIYHFLCALCIMHFINGWLKRDLNIFPSGFWLNMEMLYWKESKRELPWL